MGDADANVQITDARFLSIVSAYAARIGLVEEIDRMLPCDMEVTEVLHNRVNKKQ